MENNGGLTGGIFSAMIGLELPLHQQQHHHHNQNQNQNQNHQNPQSSHLLHPFSSSSHHDSDHQNLQQSQQLLKNPYPYPSNSKPKPQIQSPISDEDDPSNFYGDDNNTTIDGKRKAASMLSPWQRMKWTDNMVRLLIMAVFYIGDEAGSSELNNDQTGKKKIGALAQKKGKWKSVSQAMMEKGFNVSPQQCEDKFNDLNKRYKRVNDILGKGTACKVVENQNLLESMELSPKMKEEVKKLLNSKHLFFREMCAYHNSCGHAQENPLPNSRSEVEGPKMAKRVVIDEGEEEDEGEEGDESDDDGDGDDHEDEDEDGDDDDDDDENPTRKRQRTTTTALTPTLPQVFSLSSSIMQQLNSELMGVIEDRGKSSWEKKHWMKIRLMQLEEKQVSYQYQAFELEKQRLKWVKFSSKKERDMEKSKLENERRRLENERMLLLIRQKELEFLDLQQIHQHQQFSSSRRGDPSSVTG
ncbi:sequence-specific DNA binding transcription factors [Euphorbia peplus]|nr:sequence-specific DNA binding transcription factors [Euphorbia peplus]